VSVVRRYLDYIVALPKLLSFPVQYNPVFVKSLGLSDDGTLLENIFLRVHCLVFTGLLA